MNGSPVRCAALALGAALFAAQAGAAGRPEDLALRFGADRAGSALGTGIALAGDVNGDGAADLLLGAPGYGDGQAGEGAVFLVLGPVLDRPDLAGAVRLESNQAGAALGASLAAAGDLNGDGLDDFVLGAPGWDGGEKDEGAAFVVLGRKTGWTAGPVSALAAVRIESNQAEAHLGAAVAGAGDVDGDGRADLLVGAPDYDQGETDEGAAWVFLGGGPAVVGRDPSSAAARIEANQELARLGVSVAGAGDVDGDGFDDVLAGAPGWTAGQEREGAAFLYRGGTALGPVSGPPAAMARIESNQAGAGLGGSVAGAGDVDGDGHADVILGAAGWDAAQADAGGAFVFRGTVNGLAGSNPAASAARLEGRSAGAALGASVAGLGDADGDGYADVAAGAPGEGAVYRLYGGAKGLRIGEAAAGPTWRVPPAEGSGDIRFGAGLAGGADLDGDGRADVVAGAPLAGGGGAVFVAWGRPEWRLATASFAEIPTRIERGHGRSFAESVAAAGDVNGDGYGDLLIGDPADDEATPSLPAGPSWGSAFVLLGGPRGAQSGDPSSGAIRIRGDGSTLFLGYLVAGAGDVNGDGYDDILTTGVQGGGPPGAQAALIFYGGPSGPAGRTAGEAASRIETGQAEAAIESIAGAGDVNGDGFADIVIGVPRWDHGEDNEGGAFLFLGGPDGVAGGRIDDADAVIEGQQAGAWLGYSVAGAGDVNGDGYDDVVVGAPFYNSGEAGQIGAFVFHGGPQGLAAGSPENAAARLETALFTTVAGTGDVNGDGFGDVLAGAFLRTGGPQGIRSGGAETAAAVIENDQPGSYLDTWWLAGLGDADGDGSNEVVAWAPSYFAGRRGTAYVFQGGPDGLRGNRPAAAAARFDSDPTCDPFPFQRFVGAGDLDGDGRDDLAIGASCFGAEHAGAAFVVYGGGGAGRPASARLVRSKGTSTRIAPGGLAGPEGFRVRRTVTDPRGAAKVRLQVEACPRQVAFEGPGCVVQTGPGWIDLKAGEAVGLETALAGLTPGVTWKARARVERAHRGVGRPGVAPPPHPAHGPWSPVRGVLGPATVRTERPQQVFVQFTAPASRTAEGAAPLEVGLVVTTSDGLPTRRSLRGFKVIARDGTAQAGQDHGLVDFALDLPAGTPSGTLRTVAVDVPEDEEEEGEESFLLVLRDSAGAERSLHRVAVEAVDQEAP